jgi:hypothetical protein
MKPSKFISSPLFILILIFSGSCAMAQLDSKISSRYSKLELSSKIINQDNSSTSKNNLDALNQSKPGEKSPYLGALFSGIIPGTGEFYSKHYLKGAIFLAVEAGLWIAYASYQSKGNSQTDQFQAFADQNWNVYQYAGWLKTVGFSGSGNIDLNSDPNTLLDQINECERQSGFSHQLPHYGEQQYYELIGKYQTFISGWKDVDLNYLNQNQVNYQTYRTEMFESYSYSRQQANKYYDDANTMTTLVILNHILSAADAAWSVTMFNKDLKVKTSVHMENKYSYFGERKSIPVANLSVTF